MNKGDIIFFIAKPHRIMDFLISFFSRSKRGIFHVAIYVDGGTTIETNFNKKVGYSTIGDYATQYTFKSVPNITDEQRQGIIDYCLQHFNEEYDLLEIVKMFFRYFYISVPYHETTRKICSTLVWNAYHSVGIDLTESVDCTPEDLFESELLN